MTVKLKWVENNPARLGLGLIRQLLRRMDEAGNKLIKLRKDLDAIQKTYDTLIEFCLVYDKKQKDANEKTKTNS